MGRHVSPFSTCHFLRILCNPLLVELYPQMPPSQVVRLHCRRSLCPSRITLVVAGKPWIRPATSFFSPPSLNSPVMDSVTLTLPGIFSSPSDCESTLGKSSIVINNCRLTFVPTCKPWFFSPFPRALDPGLKHYATSFKPFF